MGVLRTGEITMENSTRECNRDCVHCKEIAVFCKQNILMAVIKQNTDDIEQIDEAAGIAENVFTPPKKRGRKKKPLADSKAMI
jgi:hypothetical protein